MPMDADRLALHMMTAATVPVTTPVLRQQMFKALAQAIIDEVKAATVTVSSVSGVTTGGGVSGPGTGSIT